MKKVFIISLAAVTVGCQAVPEQRSQLAPSTSQSSTQSVMQQTSVSTESTAVASSSSAVATAETQSSVQQPVATPAPAVAEPAKASAHVRLAQATAPKVSSRAQAMDPRMDKVVKLINNSSGARQVQGSNSADAQAYYQQAKDIYQQALNANSKAEAGRLLDEAVKTMYAAIRAASPRSLSAEKHQRDFDKLHRSVDTFLEQHQRISEEKGIRSEGLALRGQVNMLVKEAENTLAANDAKGAQEMLREAFKMLRNDLQLMRGGETLVHSLNFGTKKEEYDYELARYKSQRMLVDVLLRDKMKSSAYVAKQVTGYIKVAEEQRQIAEGQAADGGFEAAIDSLGLARKQLVRSLRTGGIYVPG